MRKLSFMMISLGILLGMAARAEGSSRTHSQQYVQPDGSITGTTTTLQRIKPKAKDNARTVEAKLKDLTQRLKDSGYAKADFEVRNLADSSFSADEISKKLQENYKLGAVEADRSAQDLVALRRASTQTEKAMKVRRLDRDQKSSTKTSTGVD